MFEIPASPLLVIEPLRIHKVKSSSSLHRNDSSASTSSSLSYISGSSSSTESIAAAASAPRLKAPVVELQEEVDPVMEAERFHRARHDSWVISQRLVERAEDTFEQLLWQGVDMEAAEIRVRVAREEEAKCRRRMDMAAVEMLNLKRKRSRRGRRATQKPEGFAPLGATVAPAVPRIPSRLPGSTSEPPAKEDTKTEVPVRRSKCCVGPCLCSAVFAMME